MVWKKRSSSNGFKWAILSYVEIAQGRDEIPSPFPGKHWIPDTSGGRSRTKLLQKWHVYPSGIKHGKLGRWIKFCKMRAPQIIQVINDHFGLKPTVTWGSTISVERPTTPGVMEKTSHHPWLDSFYQSHDISWRPTPLPDICEGNLDLGAAPAMLTPADLEAG